jgi:hypothetical protein
MVCCVGLNGDLPQPIMLKKDNCDKVKGVSLCREIISRPGKSQNLCLQHARMDDY